MPYQPAPDQVPPGPVRKFHKGPIACRGLTMIECLSVLSITATTLGLAAPSLDAWRQRQALLSAAAELETDMQLARSTAVARAQTVRVATMPTGTGSCYVIHTGDAGQCRCSSQGQSSCSSAGATVLRVVDLPAGGPVRLSSTAISIGFDPALGTVTPTATFKLTDAKGRNLHQVVSIMGRVRSCTPGGWLKGIKSC